MLLIDDDSAQITEGYAFLDQSVGAYRYRDRPIGQTLDDLIFFCGAEAALEQSQLHTQRFQNRLERQIMLLCQDLCGRHQRALIAAFCGL